MLQSSLETGPATDLGRQRRRALAERSALRHSGPARPPTAHGSDIPDLHARGNGDCGWTFRDCRRVGAAANTPTVQSRRDGTAGDPAEGQSGRSGVGAESLDETARKLDGKGHFDIDDRDWVLESLCLLEVAIGLALGDGAIAGQLLGSLGPMRIALQKGAG